MDHTTTPSSDGGQSAVRDRRRKTRHSPSDIGHTTTASSDGGQSAVRDRRGKTRQRSPDKEITRKSQKTSDMSNERSGVPSTDNASGAGPSITCKH